MNPTRRKILISATGTAAGALCCRSYGAKAWPQAPISFIVPYTAGGGTDLLARALAQRLSPRLGTSVIVENRPGAAGNIGAAVVAHDNSDYKLLFTTATIAISASLYKHLNYRLATDLLPVSVVTSSPLVLVVPASSSSHTLHDLVELARTKSGGLNFGSPGVGSTSHLGCAMLTHALNFKALHIPYKGASQVVLALISGQVDFSVLAAVAAAPALRQGTLRILGIAGAHPPPGIGQAPLLARTYPQLRFDNWQALFAPRAASAAMVNRLDAELQSILKEPDIVDMIHANGATPLGYSPKKTASFINEEVAHYRKIIDEVQIATE
jgi:tripartite-type tricarboxylate transporter receptor subunit TctC